MEKSRSRKFVADTLAMFIYGVIAGTFTLFYEVALAKFTIEQWFYMRLLYNFIKFGGAFLCGIMIDAVRKKINGNSNHWFRRIAGDIITISLYQIIVYILCIVIIIYTNYIGYGFMDISHEQIMLIIKMAIVENLVLGRLYSYFLDKSRKWLGL